MKRFIALLLLAVTLTLSLASCNKPEPTDNEWKYVTELPTYIDEPKHLVIYHNVKDIWEEVGEYKVYVKGYGSAAVTPKNCLFECIGTLRVSILEQTWCASILYTDHLGRSRSIFLDFDDWITKETNKNA